MKFWNRVSVSMSPQSASIQSTGGAHLDGTELHMRTSVNRAVSQLSVGRDILPRGLRLTALGLARSLHHGPWLECHSKHIHCAAGEGRGSVTKVGEYVLLGCIPLFRRLYDERDGLTHPGLDIAKFPLMRKKIISSRATSLEKSKLVGISRIFHDLHHSQ